MKRIRDAAKRAIFYTAHALEEMNAPDELITVQDIRRVIAGGQIIEEYPNDRRGHSFLLAGRAEGRWIHMVCAPKDLGLVVITAYIPDTGRWGSDFKTRRV